MLIHFGSFMGSHTSKSIAAKIEKTIDDFKLRGKVEFIVADNASNMCKVLSVLKELLTNDENEKEETVIIPLDDKTLFQDLDEEDRLDVEEALIKNSVERLACFAHSLQLVIKDRFDNCAVIRPLIEKCTALSSKCHQSAQFKESFEIKFDRSRSIPVANNTRWSSTYRQLLAISQLGKQLLQIFFRRQVMII